MKRKLIIWFLVLIILLTFSFKTTISAKEISQQDMINIDKLMSKGDYEKAEEYINKFLNDKTFNKNTSYYCSLLFSQLLIKLNIHDYEKAEEIFPKLEESIEKVFGKNSNQLIIVYTIYLKMQNTTNNDKVFLETVEKTDKIITESKDLSLIVLGKYNSIIAKFYFTRLNYKKAEEYSKKSIEYFSKEGVKDPDFVNPMIILSEINVLNGNFSEAEKDYEKLMGYIEFYKSINPEISKVIIFGYIEIKCRQGDIKPAIKFLDENKEFLDEYFKKNKAEQKEYYLILGNLYLDAFDYEQSEFYYLELIKLLDENDKKYRPLTYSNLCLLNYFRGKMKLAEKYGILALNIYNKLEKPDFANMSRTLNALGLISTFRLDFKNAERLHKDAIKYLKIVHSEKEVLASQPYICNLALVYLYSGKYKEAEKLLDEYYQPEEDIKKEITTNIVHELCTYATLRFFQGKYEESVRYFNFAITKDHALAGRDTSDIAFTLVGLSDVYLEMEDYDKAEDALKKAIEIFDNTPQLSENVKSDAFCRLAKVYIAKGDYSKAEQLSKQALKWNKQKSGYKCPSLADNYENLGIIYMHTGKMYKSKRYLMKSLKIRKLFFKNYLSPDLASSYLSLSKYYKKKGDSVKAEEFHKIAFEIYKKLYDIDHPKLKAE